MVRLGIGLYGVANSKKENGQLLNVSKLKTIVLQVNELAKGDAVGYGCRFVTDKPTKTATIPIRSEEHTSELQSRPHLVCRLLLEKKKKQIRYKNTHTTT